MTQHSWILHFKIFVILGFSYIKNWDWCYFQSLTDLQYKFRCCTLHKTCWQSYILLSVWPCFFYQFRSFCKLSGFFIFFFIDNSVINKQPASFVAVWSWTSCFEQSHEKRGFKIVSYFLDIFYNIIQSSKSFKRPFKKVWITHNVFFLLFHHDGEASTWFELKFSFSEKGTKICISSFMVLDIY